jgi:hypothetical protein
MKILRLATVPMSLAAVLALALTGCSDPETATPKTANEQEDAQFQKYVECLQEQGIKASYTQDGQGKGTFDVDSGPNDPKFKAAQQACAEFVPTELKKDASPAELDALVKVATCMRKQGVKVEDPTVEDPALHISGSVDDSAKTEGIRAACEQEVRGGASPSN